MIGCGAERELWSWAKAAELSERGNFLNQALPFSGKTAWVTGADSAVAMAVAKELYRRGASLLLSGVESPPEGLSSGGGQTVACYPRNPTDEERADRALGLVARLDLMVAGTRSPERSSIASGSAAIFDRVIEENLTAAFVALRAAARKMGRSRSGPLLVLSSIHGDKPTAGAPVFGIANGGLAMLVREAAQDLGRFGFRVNLLRYGPLEGDEAIFRSERSGIYWDMENRIPRGRPAAPEEIAMAALFLCGEDASFVNGAVLTADGGFLGHYVAGDSARRWDIGFGGGGACE